MAVKRDEKISISPPKAAKPLAFRAILAFAARFPRFPRSGDYDLFVGACLATGASCPCLRNKCFTSVPNPRKTR